MRFLSEGKRKHQAKSRLEKAAGMTIEMMESRLLFNAFTPGDLAVVRVGAPGSGSTITDTGTAVFIDEYTPSGTLVQTIAMPTAANGSNAPFVLGNNNSEGLLNLSTDGKDLLLAGYDTTPGSVSGGVDAASSTTVPRVVGEISAAGLVNTTTALTDASNGANVREVTGSNSTGFWIAGQDGTKAGGGVRYVSGLGATTSTDLIGSTIPNGRGVQIFNGQVYFTQDKFATDPVIDALDTTSGTLQEPTALSSVNVLPGSAVTNLIPVGSGAKTGSFFFAKLGTSADFQINGTDSGYNTLYVADVATTTTGASPGITKYSWTGTNWVSNGSIGSTSLNFEGFTASVTGSTVTIYATVVTPTTSTAGIVSIVDNSGFNGTITNNGSTTPTTIVTGPAGGTAYRGIAFVPTNASAPAPAVSSVAVAPTTISSGQTISLSAVVTETGGTPSSVSFYQEKTSGTENTAVDTLIPGTATNSSGTWTLSGISTTGQAAGTYKYYAVATDATNGTTSGFGTTPTASLTVIAPAPTVSLQPLSQTVIAGGSVTFTAAATGNPATTVQWEVSTDGGKTFSNIAATNTTTTGFTTTTTYTISAAVESMTGNEYEAVFSNTAGPSATTNPATLIVQGTPIAQWAFTSGIGAPAAASVSQGTGNSPYPTFGPLSNTTTILGLENDYTGVQSYPESDIIPLNSSVNSNFSELVWRIRGGSGLGPTGGPGKPDGWSQNAPEYANVNGSGQPLNTADVQGVQFNVNTTGYSKVTLHFDWDQGGISDMQPQYFDTNSSDSTFNQWVNVPGNSLITATGSDYYGITANTNPTGVSVNLQNVSVANNNPNFQFRLVAAYNSTLPNITDGNALDPTVHGQYATGTAGKVNAQQVLQFNSGITDGDTVPLTYNGASTSFIYSSTPATLITNLTAALTTLFGAGNFSVLPANYTSAAESTSTLLQPVLDELGNQATDMEVTFGGTLAATNVATMTTTNSNVVIATWVNGSTNGFQPFVDGGGSWELGNISFNGDSTVTGGLGLTVNPASTSNAGGYPVTFTASAYSETAPVTAQWQVQLPGQSTWNNVTNDGTGAGSVTSGIDISGASPSYTSTYTFTTLSNLSQSGNVYRCVFTTSPSGQTAGSVNSQPASLTVVSPAGPAIIFNPINDSVVAGTTAQFTATASGAPTPSVQWQFLSTANGATWQNLTDSAGLISGSQTSTLTYTTAADASQNGYQFRAVFTNGVSSTTSAPATLTSLTAETDITNWDFNLVTAGTFTNSPAPTGGVVGTGTATPLGMTLPYNPLDPATGTDGTGSVPDADVTSSPAIFYAPGGTLFSENTWRIRGGETATGGGTQNGWSNFVPQYTQGAEFDVPTTGYSNIYVTLDWFSTHSGELDAQRQYTLDGKTWINLGPPIQDSVDGNDDYYGDSTTGISPVVFDLTQIPGAAGDANFGIRLVNSYNVILSNVQTIELADSNGFTLSTSPGDPTQTTGTIPGSSLITPAGLAAEATAIQTALGNLPSVGGAGNVSVTGYVSADGADKPQFTITFGGSLTTIVPTLVASDSTINQNITHTYMYANAQEVGGGPVPYNGSKGNWRLDNIEVHGVAVTGPTIVGSPVINGNNTALAGAQRSTVSSIVYTFSQPVNIANTNAFNIAVVSGQTGTVPTLGWAAISPDANGGSTQWVVTFSGAGTSSGSIANGVYAITINAASVTAETGGLAMAASRTDTFWRLFGDYGGQETVNTTDKGRFNLAFGTSLGAANYIAAFDSNANNTIDVSDKGRFNLDFGITYTGFTPTI